jgi:hypothetical protein
MLILICCSFPLFEKCPHSERAEGVVLHEGAALHEGEGEELQVAVTYPMLHQTSCIPSVAQLSILVRTGLGSHT